MQGTSEDEDDDFLKGETPQNEGVVEITPNSYESNTRSPVSSIGSPSDCHAQYLESCAHWPGELEVEEVENCVQFFARKQTL